MPVYNLYTPLYIGITYKISVPINSFYMYLIDYQVSSRSAYLTAQCGNYLKKTEESSCSKEPTRTELRWLVGVVRTELTDQIVLITTLGLKSTGQYC